MPNRLVFNQDHFVVTENGGDIEIDIDNIPNFDPEEAITAVDATPLTTENTGTIDDNGALTTTEADVINNIRTRLGELVALHDNTVTRVQDLEDAMIALGILDAPA